MSDFVDEVCDHGFCTENPDLRIQLFLVFVSSFILSPWNTGFFAFFVAIIVTQVSLYFFYKSKGVPFNLIARVGLIGAAILGWGIGRLFIYVTCKFITDKAINYVVI